MAYQIVSWVRPKLPSNCPWGEEIENFHFWRENLKFFKKNIYSADNGFKLMLAWHAFFAFITRVDFCREPWFFKKMTKIFVAFFQKNQIFDKNKNSKYYIIRLPKLSTFIHSLSIYPIFLTKTELWGQKVKKREKTTFHAHFRPKSTTHNIFSEKRHKSFRLISKSFRGVGKISERSDLQFSRTWLFLQEKNKR